MTGPYNKLEIRQGVRGDSGRAAYLVLLVLVITGFLVAGGARDDLLSLLFWRPLSMVVLAIALVIGWRAAWLNGRAVLALALAVVGLTALHLVPLPPAIWTALPGRDIIVSIYRDAGMALPWQPLSAAQGPFYFYRITNNGVSVGLFANRNHQAAFLAAMFPLIAANLSLFKGKPEQLFFQRAIAIAGGLLLVPLILMTGSRAGLAVGVIGMASAWWVLRSPTAQVRSAERKTDNRKRLIGFCLTGVLLLFSIIVALRTPALQRLFQTDPADER